MAPVSLPVCSLISGFKASLTPASGGKRLTGKVLASSSLQRQRGYCQQSCVQPQEVRRKDSGPRRRDMAMANDGRVWTKAICCVLGRVCHSAGSSAGVLACPSQLHSHFTDEDTEAQRIEPTCPSVTRRQSHDWNLTAESRPIFRPCAKHR